MNQSQSDEHSMDDWMPPQWVKVIVDHIDQGRIGEASVLMNEAKVEGAILSASMPEKGFLIVTLARVMRRLSMLSRAEALLKQLLVLSPGNAPVINEIANTLQEQGKINEAGEYLLLAMKSNPDDPRVWGNLGANFVRLGQINEGFSLLKDAVEKMPHDNQLWSLLLLFMHYLENSDRDEFYEMSRKWATLNAPVSLVKREYDCVLDLNRTLRIGYISPDFRDHSVIFFFEPLLDGHNRDEVKLYGYGDVAHPDHVTERIRGKFDVYRSIHGLDSETIAQLISQDCIDVLVDLAGHAGGVGLYAMAHTPAPIQITWLGYPDTTGLSQIDYRLTDRVTDPPGSEDYYSEELFYLSDCFLCYGPGGMVPPVSKLPYEERGHITFGSFNNSSKLNETTMKLWSSILKETPNSKLLLKFKSGECDDVRALFVNRFKKYGISEDRLIISGWLPWPAHLALYSQVDIGLDTFPYNGTTTTCQSLFMGVPVITLVGEHHMSRVGLSLLKNVGLDFFAALTPEAFVSKASALAMQQGSLAKIRASLRARMAASPLCNHTRFVGHMEQAYRTMWHQYCRQNKEDSGSCSNSISV